MHGPERAVHAPPSQRATWWVPFAPVATYTAAGEAKAKALVSGVQPQRMQWLYGRKPFQEVGHVSLVIDGWIVVDNGGLGRNLWGQAICPGNVCTLKEARRGYEESFLEDANLALRQEVAIGDWHGLVAAHE